MTRTTTPERARGAGRLRLGALALVALLSAHTAVYASQFGISERFAQAMTSGGHDGWWLPASAVIVLVGFVLLVRTLGGVAHLELRARRARTTDAPVRSFASEAGSIWGRLLPLVALLFLVQENIEHLATRGHLAGLDPLIGGDLPVAIPALAVVTIGLSLLGAIVRWRVAVLQARLAADPARPPRAPAIDPLADHWRTIGALAVRPWMIVRLDAGRAPPRLLRS